MSNLRVGWHGSKYAMYSLTSIDIRPFLDLKMEAGLTYLYKNQEAVREKYCLTHFLL